MEAVAPWPWAAWSEHPAGATHQQEGGKAAGQDPSDISEPLMSSLTSRAIRSHQESPRSHHSCQCQPPSSPAEEEEEEGIHSSPSKTGRNPHFPSSDP